MANSRLRRAIIPISVLLLLFLFVHACVPKPIRDLQLVDVSRVSASALPHADSLRDTLMERGEALWKVSLSGDSDWIGEVREHGLNSYPVVVRCDRRDYALDALGPYVGQVAVTNNGDGFGEYRPASSTVQYDVYLFESGRYRSEADFNAPMPSYDLGRQRMSVCVRIAGGAMHGAYNRSNEVRLDVGAQH